MTSPTPFNGKCVLVVEDETLIAMEIAAILEEAGAEVIGPASSIEQAQALLAAGASAPDAALLDINVAGASIDPVILALKDRGVPAKLILYKGFGHPINKPKQQRAVMEHNYEWFSKYIWGEEPQLEDAEPKKLE